MFGKKFKICNTIFIIFLICLIIIQVHVNYLDKNYSKSVIEDASLDTAQLIQKYKYPVETHYVITEDNYILGLHRIPKPNAPPVLMMHGLGDSSATWIMMGPDKSLGYYLFDNGYDVWMANARGNRYSRNHTKLNPDTDPKFWKFSFHEIGYYDLPALIDYILEQTGFMKLTYFGHSQGTTAFWVLCSTQPEYNNKINMMHALAPVAYIERLKSQILESAGHRFIAAAKQYINELVPRSEMLYKICCSSKLNVHTCRGILHLILGNDYEQTNETMVPIIFGHFPAGASFRQLEHFQQLIKSKRFSQFDYGPKENMKRFGILSPPEYSLEKVHIPVVLHYTNNDNLVEEDSVKKLATLLPNVVENIFYSDVVGSHVTLLWGIDARKLAHRRMLEIMKNYI